MPLPPLPPPSLAPAPISRIWAILLCSDSVVRMPIATVAKRTARGTLIVSSLYATARSAARLHHYTATHAPITDNFPIVTVTVFGTAGNLPDFKYLYYRGRHDREVIMMAMIGGELNHR